MPALGEAVGEDEDDLSAFIDSVVNVLQDSSSSEKVIMVPADGIFWTVPLEKKLDVLIGKVFHLTMIADEDIPHKTLICS